MDRKAEIEARFGGSAEAYAQSPGHRGGPDLERMIEISKPRPTDRMIDIATGAGHTALAFAPFVAHITVTDLAQGMIDTASRLFEEASYTNADFQTVGVEQLHILGENKFDLATCRIAPHHFPDVDLATRQIASVLKKGGRFMLEDSMAPDDPAVASVLHDIESQRDPTHVRSYTRNEWIQILERAGLAVEHAESIKKKHPFEAWLERGGIGEDVKAAVRSELLSAGPDVHAALEVEIEDGRIASFTDEKIIIATVRR